MDFVVPDTGDLSADVETWLRSVLSILEKPQGGVLLRSLVAAATEDASVGAHLGRASGWRSTCRSASAGASGTVSCRRTPRSSSLGRAILGAIIVESLAARPTIRVPSSP
ncbi:TetR-like C-terminal domain-containing protein [Microbacterium sp. NRRL B-14842]|uniref:TetR-like C-terminal domain-containing protein n=1 Tax=Microbacterium sp. NRRL B-14842 TaxID=3162881 RepID=UPI003D286E0E